MLNIKNNIKQLLEPLSIYNLEPNSTTDKEISIYSKPLQTINDKIDNLLNEAIIQTATDYGLSKKIEILKLKTNETDSTEIKRQKLINMLSMNSDSFNKKDIMNALKSIGFNCQITENKKEETLIISSDDKNITSNDFETFKNLVSKMLPAHLDIIYNVGKSKTWDDINNMPINLSEKIYWQ